MGNNASATQMADLQGSKLSCALQEVVTNLMISRIEVRGEEDADVAAFRHATAREVRVVRPGRDVDAAGSVLMQSFRRVMDLLAHSKVHLSPR